MSYRFFFSYSSETYRASEGRLDEFFSGLCNRVHLKAGGDVNKIAFRDRTRLNIANFWDSELVQAMQNSNVLVAIISPHYLESSYCGRELEFFMRRFELARKQTQTPLSSHIIPIFWVDKTDCDLPSHAEKFFNAIQLKNGMMPESYPYTGLDTHYFLGQKHFCNQAVLTLGDTIKRLSDMDPLPHLTNISEFSELPSFFERTNATINIRIGCGPTSTNVAYAVATIQEASKYLGEEAAGYAEEEQYFLPFSEAPGATVELATREGLNIAGQCNNDYHRIMLDDSLIDNIKRAHDVNSPVLLVLDQSSLSVPRISNSINKYDGQDYRNVGLVTVAGLGLSEQILDLNAPTKFRGRRPHHLWTVPPTREQFVQDVANVIGGLRRELQRTGTTAISSISRPLPGI